MKVHEVEARMRGFLARRYVDAFVPPVEWQATEWIGFSQNYVRAAVVVEADNSSRSPASLYLSGHAVECALKACIRADGEASPNTHDLVRLVRRAEEKGFKLTEQQLWHLIALNWQTFADPETGTRWKARYPSVPSETDLMRPPNAVAVLYICLNLLEQVGRRVGLDFDWGAWRLDLLQRARPRAQNSGETFG